MSATQSLEDSRRQAIEAAISSIEVLGVAMEAAGVDPGLRVVSNETSAMLQNLLDSMAGGGDVSGVVVQAAKLLAKVDSIKDTAENSRRIARQIRDGSYKPEAGGGEWRRSWQARIVGLSKHGRGLAYAGLAREIDRAGARQQRGQDTLIAIDRLYQNNQVAAEAVMARAVEGLV